MKPSIAVGIRQKPAQCGHGQCFALTAWPHEHDSHRSETFLQTGRPDRQILIALLDVATCTNRGARRPRNILTLGQRAFAQVAAYHLAPSVGAICAD